MNTESETGTSSSISPSPDPENSARKRPRFPYGKILLEVSSIVLGVLLALGLSEWAEERENLALAEQALTAVNNEITGNLGILRSIHTNNSRMIETIEAGPIGSDNDATFIPGIQLQDAAWEALLASGLTNYMDFESVRSLSEVYSIQDVYKQTASQLVEASMNLFAYATALNSTVDDDHYSQQFLDIFRLVFSLEAQLLQLYEAEISDQQGGRRD